jgi:GTPase
MASNKKASIVAIIGETNVGKSSLFNLILKRKEAITAKEPGTTRDSLIARASIHPRETDDKSKKSNKPRDFWLIDTAGVKDPEDDFEMTIQDQISQATDTADIIWLTIDASAPINNDTRMLAKKALKSKKQVFLIVNKIDKSRSKKKEDFQRLGIKNIFLTSTTQRSGLEELLSALWEALSDTKIDQSSETTTIGIMGRPNVGKSQLFNSLSKKQQAIVADRAGTTRDINRTIIKYHDQDIELLDTAGIRKNSKVARGVEHFSTLRSISVIENADVCLLLMDVNELNTALDQKIAGLIKTAGKGLILVISKWDSLEDKTPQTADMILAKIKHNFSFVPWAPVIITSSVTGQNLTKIFDLALNVVEASRKSIQTAELNNWLQEVMRTHPPAGLKNQHPKLHYIIQEQENPTNFKIYGKSTKFLHWSYKRFMERKLREKYDFFGNPIHLWFFDRAPRPKP